MQQKMLFSYNFDAALHVISQINFSLDSDKIQVCLNIGWEIELYEKGKI